MGLACLRRSSSVRDCQEDEDQDEEDEDEDEVREYENEAVDEDA